MGLGIKGLCGAGNRGKPEQERIFPPRSDTREEVATSRTTHPPPLPSSVPPPAPVPRVPARAPSQKLGLAEPRPPAPPRG